MSNAYINTFTTYKTREPWGDKTITGPTVEPCTAEELRVHLRLDDSSEDVYLTTLIKAARLNIQLQIKRRLLNQTVTITCDDFPSGDWELPFPPVSSVSSITYRDQAGTTQTCTGYTLRNANQSNLSAVLQEPTTGWPSTDGYSGSVTLTMICGYGSTASALPESLVLAVKMLAAHYYEYRHVTTTDSVNQLPMHVDALVAEHKWFT